MAITASLTLAVRTKEDALWVKQEVKRFATRIPFAPEDLVRIEVAVSELASNMIKHADGGRLFVHEVERDARRGVQIIAQDKGPGIPDLGVALKSGFSTSGTLGMGLSALQELMDKFLITSEAGVGTRVEVEKWAT